MATELESCCFTWRNFEFIWNIPRCECVYISCVAKVLPKKRLNGPFREEIWFYTEIKFPLVSYFLDMLFYIQILWHEDLCKIDVANSLYQITLFGAKLMQKLDKFLPSSSENYPILINGAT